ncbi:ZIM3-like protein [Mya arenaria]|uniref:ZIM3-like protein n=1 Tax=Mya arenaria TaxID=6604 RepID=A0ABY7FXP6_MYAAR|nr:uncharacterized protein LOC128218512 [Mya arenaria]WAR26069.1 ZIM3-like protein [Mya arenaria]
MAAYTLVDDVPTSQGLPILSPDPEDRRITQQTSLLDKKADFNILEKLKHLRDNKRFCDVILEVRGVKFMAHKNVLASWSPTFASKLFNEDRNVFRDYIMVFYDNSEVFSDLLDFMYNGYVAPRETNFLQLLHLAVSFQIETLKNYCEEFLRCNLHLGNFVSTYFLSRKFKLETLEEYIVGFLQLNLSDTVKQGEFLSLKAEKFNTFLSEGWMKKIKPEIKLFLIISWVGYDVQEREKFLVLLLGHIDWSTVANDFLLEINRTENFFTSHESSLYLLLQTLYSAGIALGPYKEVFPGLRQSYSGILKEVVHASLLKNDSETFHPVTITVKERPVFKDASVNTTLSSLPCHLKDASVNTDVNNSHFVDSEIVHEPVNELVQEVEPTVSNLPEPKYDQFETLGEFIEAEIHEIKLRETQERLQKEKQLEQEVTLNEMSQITSSNTNVETPVKKKSPKKKVKSTITENDELQNLAETNFNMSKAVSEKSPIQAKNEKKSNTPKKQVILIDDFDEFHPHDAEYKPCAQELKQAELYEAMDEEDEEKDMQDLARDSVVKSIKTGGKTTPKSKRKLVKDFKQESNKVLSCQFDNCAYITKVPQRLEKHIKTAHETSFELKCNLCVFETKEVRKYNTHMKQHFPGPPFHCDYPRCTYSSEKIHTMLTHRISHTDDRPFTCDCGMRFRTNNTLIAHKKTHLGRKDYTCPECATPFATKNTLNQHLVTHSDSRPYLCDLCGFSTKFQSHLIAHKRIHTGEVFRCQFPNCQYFSPKRSQLKGHMRSHLGIRAHICDVCSKTFIERSHLIRHQKIHTNNRICCELCEYTTTRKDKLKEHFKKHHTGEVTLKAKKSKSLLGGKNKSNSKKLADNVLTSSDQSALESQGPIPMKWDHGGYSLSQVQNGTDAHEGGETLLSADGTYCVLRETLTSNETIQPILTMEQINSQMSVAKALEASGAIVSQNGGIMHGGVDGSLNSGVPVLNLLNSPLTNVEGVGAGQIVTSRMDTENGPAYTIVQSSTGLTSHSQELSGLNAFMAFI